MPSLVWKIAVLVAWRSFHMERTCVDFLDGLRLVFVKSDLATLVHAWKNAWCRSMGVAEVGVHLR